MSSGHEPGANANTRRLTWALLLTGGFLIIEVIGAYIYNSLALLSDAGHMLTDVSALAIALTAIKVGSKAPDDEHSFGYRRFEILAAAFNALMLFAVAAYVLVEGVQRLREPAEVQSMGMLVVATAGLVINLVSMKLLSAGKDGSLNVKGAWLEVWADMIGSIGVIAGAILIRFTGWSWVDPAIAILIGLWVLPRGWALLQDTTHVLLEGAPDGLNVADVREAIAQIQGVSTVHDLHLWSLSSDDRNASVHLLLATDADHEAVRAEVAVMLAQTFGISHATVQTESLPCASTGIPHK
ncbi:cation transporter [Sandaracinobacter neustonicus]|uniref:Cation transporter n=1 Tax=Sandaracinobacter neustonicus TaxID=1715348 RepID=A0A501XQ77_9SPHN|nr:cation diffusion facilitator family transporter [Sandaracinobacter neustonicus]TPE62615.1 cation transporter [Sandaracinobacter neustonicus]